VDLRLVHSVWLRQAAYGESMGRRARRARFMRTWRMRMVGIMVVGNRRMVKERGMKLIIELRMAGLIR
jgi:hypothetical protein